MAPGPALNSRLTAYRRSAATSLTTLRDRRRSACSSKRPAALTTVVRSYRRTSRGVAPDRARHSCSHLTDLPTSMVLQRIGDVEATVCHRRQTRFTTSHVVDICRWSHRAVEPGFLRPAGALRAWKISKSTSDGSALTPQGPSASRDGMGLLQTMAFDESSCVAWSELGRSTIA